MIPATLPPTYSTEVMQCVRHASVEYHVPKIVLLGIIKTESSGKADAINHNTDGTYDLGIMQINTRWAQKLSHDYGIANVQKHLMRACYNIRVGAWIVSRELQANGGWRPNHQDDFWVRVGNYHSKTRWHNHAYQVKLARNIQWIAANTAWW